MRDPFLAHFKHKQGIGCIGFFNHLLDSNSAIISDPNKFQDIIEELFCKIEGLRAVNPTRAFLIKMLSTLVGNDEKKTRPARNRVLSRLYEPKESELEFEFSSELFSQWSTSLWEAPRFTMNGDNSGVHAEAELCYILSYFELLTKCSGGKNSFAENMSQSIVSLKTLAKIFETFKPQNTHPVIKLILVNFFYEVYLETERENFFHFQQILTVLVRLMIDSF